MRANAHALGHGQSDGFLHDGGVTGVEAASYIGTFDDLQQGCVVAHCPSAKALTQVGIQVDTRSCHR